MTGKEILEYLTADLGLDEATAKVVMGLSGNPKLETKAGKLLQQSQYDDLERRAAALELSYQGTKDKPGAKQYEEWYQKNFSAIQDLQTKAKLYEERYGALDPNNPAPAAAAAATMSKDEIQKQVNEVIQATYAPQWTKYLKANGAIVQKHMRAGRKTDIDFDKLAEIAQSNGGDLVKAYDEWDRPEAELVSKASQEAEIKRRVDEELAKRNTNNFFPAGGDNSGASSGSTSPLSRSKVTTEPKYDRDKVIQTAVSGKYEPAVQ